MPLAQQGGTDSSRTMALSDMHDDFQMLAPPPRFV
jgi:hypothetical protein